MEESDFQTKFSTWLKYHPEYWGAFELKITDPDDISIPFSAVTPHQVRNLSNAKNLHFIWKIPDEGFSQKPFDCFKLQSVPAYVVIMFYRRGQKNFYIIPIDDWITKAETSTRKSLTEKEASEIGYIGTLA